MSELTVRDRVRVIQRDLRDTAPTPEVVRRFLMTLTGLLGNVNQEQRDADMAYKLVLLKAYELEAHANRARIKAETSAEYLRSREAKDTRDLVVELIRSCKVYLRSLDEEMRLSQ